MMTLSEKVDVKNNLVRIYLSLNDIKKKKELEDFLEEDLIADMNKFHENLKEFLG